MYSMTETVTDSFQSQIKLGLHKLYAKLTSAEKSAKSLRPWKRTRNHFCLRHLVYPWRNLDCVFWLYWLIRKQPSKQFSSCACIMLHLHQKIGWSRAFEKRKVLILSLLLLRLALVVPFFLHCSCCLKVLFLCTKYGLANTVSTTKKPEWS